MAQSRTNCWPGAPRFDAAVRFKTQGRERVAGRNLAQHIERGTRETQRSRNIGLLHGTATVRHRAALTQRADWLGGHRVPALLSCPHASPVPHGSVFELSLAVRGVVHAAWRAAASQRELRAGGK